MKSNLTHLKAAIAGVGFMGFTHSEALRRLGITVAGCLGSTPEKGRAALSRLHTPLAYESFDELVADPDVDVVHVCTPNNLHYPMVTAALEAGKHVICEKPLAVTSEESAALVQLAKETGLVGAVNYNLRYYPLCHEARSCIRAGELGEIRIIRGHYLQDWLLYATDWNWRLEPEEGGALRAVADLGSHWMDMVAWLTGIEISSVMADLATFVPVRFKPSQDVETFAGKLERPGTGQEVEMHTEDYASILMHFEGDARGVLTVSQLSAGRKNLFSWEVYGSEASMVWQQERPNELWTGYRDRPNELTLKDPALMGEDARAIAPFPGGHAEGYPDTFLQHFKAIYDYIAQGDSSMQPNFATFADGHKEVVIGEAVQRSADERRWVTIP